MPAPDEPQWPLFAAVKDLLGERSGDALDILRLMWTIEHDLNTLSRRMEMRQGVSGSHRAVLRYVALFPGISAAKLCELLQLHPSTLSNVFKRLQGSGLVERVEDPDDRRRARLQPTTAGIDLLRRSAGTVDAVIERVVLNSPAERLHATREVLQRIAIELQQELAVDPGAP